MAELNCALISAVPPWTSVPLGALGTAVEYQVPGKGALGKSRAMPTEPAWARVAPLASHGSAAQLALMTMGTSLLRVAPQRLAANWKAFRRCWPTVVPVLPPAGEAGVN